MGKTKAPMQGCELQHDRFELYFSGIGQNLNVYEKKHQYPSTFGTNVDVVSPSERSRPHETQMEFGFK